MSYLNHQKRIVICTVVALVSGIFSACLGGQINWKLRSHTCQTQPWGFKTLCQVQMAPIAIWQGTTTGLWFGLVLGAFVSGLATRSSAYEDDATTEQRLMQDVGFGANEVELTPPQRVALHHFLVLLMVKSANSSTEKLSLDELRVLADMAKCKH